MDQTTMKFLTRAERDQAKDARRLCLEEFAARGMWRVGPNGESAHGRWLTAALNATPRLIAEVEVLRATLRKVRGLIDPSVPTTHEHLALSCDAIDEVLCGQAGAAEDRPAGEGE